MWPGRSRPPWSPTRKSVTVTGEGRERNAVLSNSQRDEPLQGRRRRVWKSGLTWGALPGTGVRDAGAAAEPAQAWSLLDAAPREVQPALRPWHRSRHWLLPGPGPGVTSPQGSSVLLRLHLPARAGRPGSGLRIQKGLRRQRRGDSRGFRRERGVGHLVNTHLHCRGTRQGRHHDVPSCRRRRREQGWVSRPPAGHQGPGKLCPWRTGESNALAVKPKSPRRVSARALSGEAGARPRKRRSCVRAIQPRTRFAPRN